jgi:hypothetical protein
MQASMLAYGQFIARSWLAGEAGDAKSMRLARFAGKPAPTAEGQTAAL